MDINFPKIEKKILKFWKKNQIFEKLVEQRKKVKDFVFYEGPPTANAKPGIHHVLSRVFKDIIPRYKTMRGFRVLRKAGWDTHGLPVELEIEKKLGLKAKKEIEKFGIAKFNQKCRHSVWEYKKDWEKLTERIGFWLDMKEPYITYEPEYIESLWWILKEIYRKGLLYKDYKVVPYCPRCQTSLSSHEVALGYKEILTESFTAKFKLKGFSNRYILGWTTTPWTTPSNVALAVNPKIDYVAVRQRDEEYVVAKARVKHYFGENPEIVEEFKGEKLDGLEYEPLFSYFAGKLAQPAYKVVMVDYATESEGTGIVHTAPAFGEDDYQTGKKHGLAFLQPVSKEGVFTDEVSDFKGRFVIDCDKDIINLLESQAKVFSKERYKHDYPFCWRCQNPLLYFAKQAWFIKMTKVKDELLKNNQKINWVPEYIKEGRFGEWLKEVKDWTLSRERYWGTPLPVWHCQTGKSEIRNPKSETNPKSQIPNSKRCDNIVVIGSKEDLLKQKFSTNNYFIFRHGHSLRQVTNLADSSPNSRFHLTKKGKEEVLRAAKKLKRVDLIFSSDLLRARQTAEIISKETGAKIIFDKRLRELNVGIFNGKDPKLFWNYLSKQKNLCLARVPKGESLMEVRKRVYDFIKKVDPVRSFLNINSEKNCLIVPPVTGTSNGVEKKYQGKNIVIVSHEFPLTVLEETLRGFSLEEILKWRRENRSQLIKTGNWRKIEFKKLPLNQKGELDFHRPYIDEVRFYCRDCGGLMERVPEVIDCWFDSGSMPFAQGHWPFEANQKLAPYRPALYAKFIKPEKQTIRLESGAGAGLRPPELFPADYICEGIDQTRGWFYTLLAISTLLDFGPAYKNVISLGHVLDEKGEKMSKSKGNVVDPWQIIEKYGADAARWYFYTVNGPGDSKLFSEKDIQGTLRKFIFTLWNCYTFFETYAQKREIRNPTTAHFQWAGSPSPLIRAVAKSEIRNKFQILNPKSQNILDRWIISKLNGLIQQVTESLDKYDITSAARAIEKFVVNDFSLWYIRRSRRRFQRPENKKELQEASAALNYVLLTLSKLTAPFTPFLSEEIYRKIFNFQFSIFNSVHLENWPKADRRLINKKLNEKMAKVRDIVALALAERAKAGIKVRQPLAKLQIANGKLEIEKELVDLIKEEVNVKEIIFDSKIKQEVEIDTRITPELKEEGIIREVIRHIQEMRKKAGLKPKDKISVWFFGSLNLNELLTKNREIIIGEGKIKNFQAKSKEKEIFALEKKVKVDREILWLAIKKI